MGAQRMNDFYEFLTGPALWAAFIIFIVGLSVRLTYLYGMSKERDRVLYNHVNVKWAVRSIVHWLIPLGSVGLRAPTSFRNSLFPVPSLFAGRSYLFACAQYALAGSIRRRASFAAGFCRRRAHGGLSVGGRSPAGQKNSPR